jgi:hypothetical protein
MMTTREFEKYIATVEERRIRAERIITFFLEPVMSQTWPHKRGAGIRAREYAVMENPTSMTDPPRARIESGTSVEIAATAALKGTRGRKRPLAPSSPRFKMRPPPRICPQAS